MFTIGALWMFSKSHMRLSAATLAMSSLMVVLVTAVMETMVNFSYSIFAISYVGGIVPLAVGRVHLP